MNFQSNIHNIAFSGLARDPTYDAPEYYSQIVGDVLYRFDANDWDYCQVISLTTVTPGFSYAHACGDSKLPQTIVVLPRPIPVRDAPLRPSDAEEAASYRRAQALTRSKRVYKFSYGQQRLFINGIPCQGPLTRSQARKKRVFSLAKIAERRAAAKEQLRLERFERLWGEGSRAFLQSLGYKRQFIAPYVPFPALPTSIRQEKNTTLRSSINSSVLGTYVPIVEAVRDSGLAYKLRQLIKGFRTTFVKVLIKSVSLRDCIRAVYICKASPQMDQGSHGVPDDITAEKISNTVITTHNEESVGASPTTVLNWHSLTTTDPEQEYNFGTDRWNIFDVVEWNKNQVSCAEVLKISVPLDLMAKCWAQPSMALFKSNRYWRSDIELRFQLNTNKFQTGSLQCSYLYDCADDYGFSYRGNAYCLSQSNHCILDASGSNMGTLMIPYKFNNPYINTDNDKEYCRVFVKVLNALDCPSTVMGSASLTVYYRFVNAKFMGTLDNALIVPPKVQMLTLMRALGAAAEAGLRSVNKDLNRDKPPEPSCPVPFTPRSTSSWCIGTNLVEPTNLLRLDSTGQTPHPNLILSSMKVKDIVNIFGLIVLDLKWSVDHISGSKLLRLDAAPIQKFSDGIGMPTNWPIYPSAEMCYFIPPISFVSAMFSYWRGTMDLRIDIVGTPFHKGQLLISYIPRNHKLDEVANNVTMDMAKSSNYTICDLSETRSFTINIPYISSRPMYPVKYSQGKGNLIAPPGYINIFVLNPLIPMDQVSRTVSINMYLKAGNDFELMVPCQPSIGLMYDPVFKPEPDNVIKVNKPFNPKFRAGLIPFNFTDSEPILYISSNLNAYIGNVVTSNYVKDFAIQVPTQPFFKVESYTIRLINPITTNILCDRKTKAWWPVTTFNYAALIERETDNFVMAPITKEFIKWYQSVDNKHKSFTGLITKREWLDYYSVNASDETRNKYCKDAYNVFDDYVLKVPSSTTNCLFWLHSDPQMDERQLEVNPVVPMSGSLPTTNSGLTILGENFDDLKTLCRRYQKLFNANIILDNTRTDKMSISFPVTPMGIINNSKNLDSTIPELFNRCRDGIIPLIASGFRFWRGSLRYRITTDSRLDINIIVQHRPDITSSMFEVTTITDNYDRNSYLNHGYSMVIQNLNVNNCVDVEVPWYSPFMLASCHPGADNQGKDLKYSLGSLFIGFNNSSSLKNVGISVYYCIGDDFRFDTFQGFPMIVSVNSAAVASPQMFSTIKSWVNLPKEIKKANDTASDFQENVLPKIKNTISQELSNKFINVYEVLCDVASQLVHCVINPTTKTILWSVFSCFVKFGLLTLKCATKLVTLAQKIFSFVVGVGTFPIRFAYMMSRFNVVKGKVYFRFVEIDYDNYSFSERVLIYRYIDHLFAHAQRFKGKQHKTFMPVDIEAIKHLDQKLNATDMYKHFNRSLTNYNYEEYLDFARVYFKNLKKPIVPEPIPITEEEQEEMAKHYPEILNPFFDDEDEDEADAIPRANVEMDGETQEDVAASMISIIYSSVCTLLSFTCKGEKSFKEYVPILLKGMGTTASGANNIFRFIKNNFKLFNLMYEKVMYNKYFCLRRYRILETENLDLNNWANSVSILLQPRFRTFVDNKQLWRDAVFGAARYGFLYLAEGTKNPQKKTNVDPFIRKLYDQIVRLRDELQQQKLFPSLRQEAFAIWIHGPPGVGKSTMIDDLTTNMLKAINFTHLNELKYTISPVTKHWDGCNQQPVVVIDDAFAVDEPEANAQQLWAYFQICSPIPLRPPMARLEDKSMTYNPEIFVTCANNSFPAITMLREKDALWRRRHLLIKTQLKSNCTSKDYPFGLTPDQVRNFEHMEFSIAKDPRSEKNPGYMGWMSYQNLVDVCIKNFKEFKIKSKATYEARHELHYSLYPQELHIPEEETLRNLYHKDNEKRAALIGDVVDTFGITIRDSVSTLKSIASDVKAVPSTSTRPPHPSVSQQAVDLAIASMDECFVPVRLSQIIEISANAELEKGVSGQMKEEVPTITEYLGLADTQALVCNTLDKNNPRQLMITACDNIVNENKEAPEATILLGMSEDFKNFEEGLATTLGKFVNVDFSSKFMVLDIKHFEKAPFLNKQLNGSPVMTKILEENCLHELLNLNTPIIKTDDGKYLFWLVEYQGNNFCVYDHPCSSKNCVFLNNQTKRYQRFISFVYAWYSKNYNYLLNVHKKFLKDGGINFLFLDQFSLCERYSLNIRNLVVSAINRYQEFGVWKGYILPSAHWLGGWLSQIYSTLQTLLGVCGMLSIGYFTYKMWSPSAPVPKTKPKMAKGQLISSGDSGTHNRPNNTRLIVSKKLSARQQSSDHCLSSVIRKRINNNTVYIEFSDNKTNRQAVMKCLIVKGRHMLVIKHYYDYLSTYTSEDSSCYLCWNDVGRIPFKFEEFEWNWFENSNFGLVELPKTVSERKSLIGFMATEHQSNTNLSPDCEIIDINAETMKIYDERISYCGTVVIEPSSYSEELVMDGCWRYSRNYPGMCGSVLLSKNLTNPILGMHVAGGRGFGYSEPLTREMFSELEGKLDGPIVEYRELDIPQIPIEERKVYLRGTHRYAGNIDAEITDDDIKLAKVENGITKIVPSLLHGLYPVLSEPSPLTPKDSRLNPKFSPLVEGCEKMCNPTYEFNPCDIAESEEHLLQKLLSCVKPLRMNVDPLTISQSLNGIPDIPGYEHINWDTSEGFPLSRIRPTGARNKRWLFNFNSEGKAVGIHDALLTIMDQKMDDRKKGIVPVTLHDDCLKDARIPLDKINVPGKTRIFSISPVDFTIHFRQYYLDFIAAYGAARFKAEHAIGINVHGLEWTDLANLVGSDFMITGDYSGFGPTLNTEVLHAAFRIIFKWYQYHGCADEDHKIRYVMSREIANARHLMRDYVYQTSCGMPSGNPGTVIFNSLVNSIYIRCAYLKIMRNTLYGGLSCFSRYVTLVTYGDDLIAKLHPNIVNNFNFNSLSQFFFDKNLKFTDAAKTGISVDPTLTLKQATFLKHCFNPHPTRNGVYLAGLDKASITECVNWVRSSPDMKDATYQNCNQATMLAYGWGPEYFNDLVKTIRVAWREKFDEYFECRTWIELDSLFLDQNWDPNLKW